MQDRGIMRYLLPCSPKSFLLRRVMQETDNAVRVYSCLLPLGSKRIIEYHITERKVKGIGVKYLVTRGRVSLVVDIEPVWTIENYVPMRTKVALGGWPREVVRRGLRDTAGISHLVARPPLQSMTT